MSPKNDYAFYQTIDIPGIGECRGQWDHRKTVDAYLGRVNLRGKSVLDIGPANGFFTFAMEQRGAEVTALDLGGEGDWDAVPNPQAPWTPEDFMANLRNFVRKVENAFWLAHKALGSNVRVLHGTIYDAPTVLKGKVDVALIGNVLQHLRDPFLALQRVSQVVRNTMIITEAAWNAEKAFLNGMDMRFLPRLEISACQSWWLVPPRLVAEILKLLGFGDVKLDYHDQWFNGSDGVSKPRMVRHYTVTGTRTGYNLRFGEDWHNGEANGRDTWRWSKGSHACVMLEIENKSPALANLTLRVRSLAPCHMRIKLNGALISEFDCFRRKVTQEIKTVEFKPGRNLIDILSDKPARQGSRRDPRLLGFALYHLGFDWQPPRLLS